MQCCIFMMSSQYAPKCLKACLSWAYKQNLHDMQTMPCMNAYHLQLLGELDGYKRHATAVMS